VGQLRGSSIITGETGEHLVLAELYRRGVLAGQVARGAGDMDVVTSTGYTLQVKAKRGKGRWVLWQKARPPHVDFVVLVTVAIEHRDDEFFVIPVIDLDRYAEARNQTYRDTKPAGWASGEADLFQLREEERRFPVAGQYPADFLMLYRDDWGPLLRPRVEQGAPTPPV
jgi:hypothetical protein